VTEIVSKLSLGLFPAMLTTTRDQVEMLRTDNVVSEAAKAEGRTLEGLGVETESFRAIAPTYLWRYRATGQYDSRKLA
ncbi:MAG: complex I NDUFA9 subunit family protein, partial [Hyphomicrobiales bacterium]|nr:complex I NDUFA9 subunit family protein [Hyphomicrobiales bacterium]